MDFSISFFFVLQITLADIALFAFIECLIDPEEAAFHDLNSHFLRRRLTLLDDHHRLKHVFDTVREQEGIKRYLEARPKRHM